MSTEQHEALRICEEVTEYVGMTVDESNRAKVHLKEMHALIVQMAEALESACDHIEMGALEVSHCKDHERITQAIAAATQYLTRGPKT